MICLMLLMSGMAFPASRNLMKKSLCARAVFAFSALIDRKGANPPNRWEGEVGPENRRLLAGKLKREIANGKSGRRTAPGERMQLADSLLDDGVIGELASVNH